jgi:hypothetical protein
MPLIHILEEQKMHAVIFTISYRNAKLVAIKKGLEPHTTKNLRKLCRG